MSAAATTTGEELRVLLVEDTRADAELCLAELDRGETVPFEDSMRRVREIIARAEAERAGKK